MGQMTAKAFRGKRVVILGLARQGVALARFFHAGGAQITISDIAPAEHLTEPLAQIAALDNIRLVLGGHPFSLLDNCDLLCLSGGVPPQIPLVQAARQRGIPLSNDTLITIQYSPAAVAGITGSSGKTTTTTLVGLMLQETLAQNSSGASCRVWVGGNIGTPLVDRLDQIRADDKIVLELSSFQLELFDTAAGGQSCSPHLAAVLNITPNHLDRHPSMAHYTASKANILRWQGSDDVAVLGADNVVTGRWLRSGQVEIEAGRGQVERRFPLRARLLGFGAGEAVGEGCWLENDVLVLRLDGREHFLLTAREIRLRGQHNVLNVLAACATAAAAGVDPQAMAEVVHRFEGVPHRLELVRQLNGVQWINDSIATSPERAAAALRSFDEPIILLAGGRDKKLPWDEFARLVHQRARHLIVFGEAAALIAEAVTRVEHQQPFPITHCADLAEAVQEAARIAQPGDVVLLAPGGTSFDAYKDFEARGQHFRDLVNAL